MGDLVLLPGTLCDDRLFESQVAALSSDVRCTVGDLTRDDSIAAMAQRVLATAPDTFNLAGLSLGGIVALEVIRLAPERVERLALLDTNHKAPTPEQRVEWSRFDHMARTGEFDRITAELLLPSLIWNQDDPRLTALVVDMARAIGPAAFIRQNAAQFTRRDQSDLLAGIDCPTLVLCGAEERVCPVELHREIARSIPESELVVVAEAGHLSTLDNPAGVTDALAHWLDRPVTRRPPSAHSHLPGRGSSSAAFSNNGAATRPQRQGETIS